MWLEGDKTKGEEPCRILSLPTICLPSAGRMATRHRMPRLVGFRMSLLIISLSS